MIVNEHERRDEKINGKIEERKRKREWTKAEWENEKFWIGQKDPKISSTSMYQSVKNWFRN